MANIRKRGNTYQIRVSCGYDIRGVQQFQSKTWKALMRGHATAIEIHLYKIFRQPYLHMFTDQQSFF